MPRDIFKHHDEMKGPVPSRGDASDLFVIKKGVR